MEIVPPAMFPEECDGIYHLGRLTAWRTLYAIGSFFAALGALTVSSALAAPPGGGEPSVGGASLGAFAFVFGTVIFVYAVLCRGRTAVAITSEALYYRTWLGRVWYVPWDSLEELAVRTSFSEPESSLGGVEEETAYLTGRAASGGRATLKIPTAARPQLAPSDGIKAGPLVSAIVRCAGLAPATASRFGRTWVRAEVAPEQAKPRVSER